MYENLLALMHFHMLTSPLYCIIVDSANMELVNNTKETAAHLAIRDGCCKSRMWGVYNHFQALRIQGDFKEQRDLALSSLMARTQCDMIVAVGRLLALWFCFESLRDKRFGFGFSTFGIFLAAVGLSHTPFVGQRFKSVLAERGWNETVTVVLLLVATIVVCVLVRELI
jgi:hypothetical protein